jgi:hypothetical protein
MATSDKYLYVGSVDNGFKILDKGYKVAERLKINFGTIGVKIRNESLLKRASHQHF